MKNPSTGDPIRAEDETKGERTMPITPIGSKLNIEATATRTRQTIKPTSTFSQVLKGGAQVLLAGAEIASKVMGGSVLTAALSSARQELGGPGAPNGSSRGGGGSDFDALRQVQEESREMNVFFLDLQQRMQAENRRFTTISNVLKSRHDTARAAINNIRS